MTRIVVLLVGICLLNGSASCAPGADPSQRVQQRAAEAERIFTVAAEDSLLAREQDMPTARRVGLWARRFAAASGVRYRFGLAEGGYAADGEIVSDRRQDCVSLLYRTSELARARDHRDAVAWALQTRFAGARLDSLIGPDGRVDYDDRRHLDFSLDMIRSGRWGRDVTAELGGAVVDTAGSSRYAPGSFRYLPKADFDLAKLREGDVVWFVLDAGHPAARRWREDHGLVVGHIGLIIVEGGEAVLVHAASSDLEGFYEGGSVVTVPLASYLERVERFGGVVITRFP